MTIVRQPIGVDTLPRLAAGNYMFATSPSGGSTSNAHGNNVLRLMPWWVPRPLEIDRIGAEITAAGEAGSKMRLGIYADNGNAYPGALLLDAGQIAADSATVQELTCALTLSSGLYWIGGAVQGAPTTPPTVRINSTWYPPVPIAVGGMPAANSTAVGYSQTGVTGALPATFTSTIGTAGSAVRTFVRTA